MLVAGLSCLLGGRAAYILVPHAILLPTRHCFATNKLHPLRLQGQTLQWVPNRLYFYLYITGACASYLGVVRHFIQEYIELQGVVAVMRDLIKEYIELQRFVDLSGIL